MNPKRKTIISSLIFGTMALILIWFFVHSLFKGIKKNSEDLILAKKELIFLQAKIENLEQFKEIYLTLRPNLEKADFLFIDPKVPIDFIKFLEKTEEDSGVLIDISPVSIRETEGDLWSSMGFQIILTGSFPDCLKFLEKIETSPYLIEIQNLTIKRLAAKELKSTLPQTLVEGDVVGTLLMKVFTK